MHFNNYLEQFNNSNFGRRSSISIFTKVLYMVIKTDISIFFFNLRKNPIVFSYGVGVVCQE